MLEKKRKRRTLMRPVIGINTDFVEAESAERKRLGYDLFQTCAPYIDAVIDAGGVPLLLPCVDDPVVTRRHVELIDGLLLVGGKDYDPALFGETTVPELKPIHPKRGKVDVELCRLALTTTDKPILGICTGEQLLNIIAGGGVIQHLPNAVDHLDWKRHAARFVEETRLRDVFRGTTELNVNSNHHQAVNPERLGRGVRVAASAPCGVVEAIEIPGERFVVGVQWHPERMEPNHRRAIFDAFVKAAGAPTRE